MRKRDGWLVLVLLVVGWSGMATGAEPDPEAVRRLMEKYEREAAEEAAKRAPAPKPQPRPKPAPTVNYDHEAWKSAERCGTAACFRAYLKKHPQGHYAEMARARLESASISLPVVTERPAAKPRPDETLIADRYRDHGDGTVTDVKTDLQWMRCSLGQMWRDGTCIGEPETYVWQGALDAAKALNRQGGYAGYRNWRAPTKDELKTLIYCSSGQPKTWNDTGEVCQGDYKHPTIYQPVFPNTLNWMYWSSTEAPDFGDVWIVAFASGLANTHRLGNYNAVRLVRGGQ